MNARDLTALIDSNKTTLTSIVIADAQLTGGDCWKSVFGWMLNHVQLEYLCLARLDKLEDELRVDLDNGNNGHMEQYAEWSGFEAIRSVLVKFVTDIEYLDIVLSDSEYDSEGSDSADEDEANEYYSGYYENGYGWDSDGDYHEYDDGYDDSDYGGDY